ncbi:Six-hairpin glycosidase-like protein [Aspergillus pseudodeflectus]|uniref:Six-hairpin glycosidase-like protein n=1 Tax=Aspergillus pseudodeflectus TaxID=176178 RepID=A0ABR4L4T1_9EURO
MKSAELLGLAASLLPMAAALDAEALAAQYFGNDAPWYRDRIPLFKSSVSEIEEVYYYRWGLFRAHQRDLGAEGFLSTEFINDVGWQVSPWAILINAANYHLREGRWSRDRRFKEDYANVLFGSNTNPHQFSEVMADGVWQGYLVDGALKDAAARLESMQRVYNSWNTTENIGGYDTSKGLYYIQPLTDATEYTIASIDASGGIDGFTGGNAFRPSINSYQYANALAISHLAALTGDHALADEYRDRAETVKELVQEHLWNSTFEHFIDRFYVDNEYVTYWDPIRGRELVGYVPWTHDLPDDDETFAQAWKHIIDPEKLAGSHGLRTNEPSYEYYMRQYRYEGDHPECQWNGPAWPYQTTQALTALANLLDHYPTSSATGIVTKSDYVAILLQYAQLHYNPSYDGILNLEEDYNADTGVPIVGLTRSPHYFHSGFIDQVITGFVGIRPSADDILEVNPLIDDTVEYFRIERILYHGHDVAVQWDASGDRYGTRGLTVEVDGEVVAQSDTLTRQTIEIARVSPPEISRPIALSIQLGVDTEYPVGSVSVQGVDTASIHNVIDGRVWFYPEIVNWWDTPAGNGSEIWYQIDFGQTVKVSRAEIAFAAGDALGVDVPSGYRIQVSEGGEWVDVDVGDAGYEDAVANGITNVQWESVEARLIRLVFTPKEGVAVRLVELKIF